MEENKLKDIVKFCAEVKNENDMYENVKILLRSLIGEDAKSTKDLWFQSDEIKSEANYYNLVIWQIEILYRNLKNKNDFNLKKISEEIVGAIQKTEYSKIYQITRQIFFKVDPTEIEYYDIFCSVCFLGFKKESPLNKDFIFNLKDLKEYEIMENSPYSKEIENFNYDILDEEFLQNFNIFIDYILQKPPEEEKVNKILKELKEPDRNSSNNIIIEENAFIDFLDNSPIKSNDDTNRNKNKDNSHKNAEKDIKLNITQNNNQKKKDIDSNLNNIQVVGYYDVNPKNIQDNNKKGNNDTELNITHINSPEKDKDKINTIQYGNQSQVDIPKENSEANLKNIKANNQKENDDNNLNNTQNRYSAKEEVNNKKIPYSNNIQFNGTIINPNNILKDFDKDESTKDIQNENFQKDDDIKKKSLIKNEENTKNLSPINSNIEEDISNNQETQITISKKIDSEIDDDSYEKFKGKNKLQFKENILTEKTIMIYTKRIYLVNGLIHMKSKIKQQMKEFCDISKYQKDKLNYICITQENSINIAILKSVLKRINPPAIFNIRRKFIDLIIYWIIKKNDTKFQLDKNYIPKNNYLKLISKILEKKEKNSEIEQKINFLSDLKSKVISTISYPMTINDNLLDNLFSYLQFYKRKCSNVVHIGKEGFKYYDLDALIENDKIDFYKVFKEYENGKEIKDIKMETSPEKTLEIDIEFVFKFLFYSKFENKNIDTDFEDKLKLINKEKIEIYDSPIDYMTKAFNKMLITLEKSTNIPEFELDDYEDEEKTIIENSLKEFNFQITSFKELIRNLEKEKNLPEYIKNIDVINEELYSLVNKECFLTDKYYIGLDVKEVGSIFLLYLQYKYMKLRSLYELIEEVCKKYLDFLQRNKIHIETMAEKVKIEEEIFYKKIFAENVIQSGKDIFQEWKAMKKKKYYYENFLAELRKALKEISLIKIDDNVINDMINSCWLVKTKLDEYVLD